MKLTFQLKMLVKRPEFYISFFAMLIFALVPVLINCINYYGTDLSVTVAANQLMLIFFSDNYTAYFALLLPLIIGIPFSDSFYIEKQNNILPVIISRAGNRRKYYFSKLIAVFLSSLIIVLIPLLVNFLLSMIAFPLTTIKDCSNWSSDEMYFYNKAFEDYILLPKLFVLHPYIYNLVFCFSLSVFSGLAGVFVFTASFFIKKSRILIISCFFIVMCIIQMLSLFVQNYNININYLDYFFAVNDRMTGSNKYFTLLVLMIIFLLAICIMSFINIKKMDDILCDK